MKIELDFKDSSEIYVEANSSEFDRIILNLINNSVDALKDNSGKILVAIRGYKDLALVIVQDNGRGISEERLATLGARGVSYDREGSDSGSGNGLGLFYTKTKVQEWGGQVQFLSRENVGTTIEIRLERKPNPNARPVPLSEASFLFCGSGASAN